MVAKIWRLIQQLLPGSGNAFCELHSPSVLKKGLQQASAYTWIEVVDWV